MKINKTSDWNQYQKDYKKEHYVQLGIHLDKDLARRFKEKLKKDGLTVSGFIRDAILAYLAK